MRAEERLAEPAAGFLPRLLQGNPDVQTGKPPLRSGQGRPAVGSRSTVAPLHLRPETHYSRHGSFVERGRPEAIA